MDGTEADSRADEPRERRYLENNGEKGGLIRVSSDLWEVPRYLLLNLGVMHDPGGTVMNHKILHL